MASIIKRHHLIPFVVLGLIFTGILTLPSAFAQDDATPTPIPTEEPPTEPPQAEAQTEISQNEPENFSAGVMAIQTFCQLDISDLNDNNPFTYGFAAINTSNIASYDWNLGDGTLGSGSSLTHTYTGTGTFNVTLICHPNSGSDLTLSGSITVSSTPTAAFTLTPATTITGLPPFVISTVNQSSGGGLSHNWQVTDAAFNVLYTSSDENITYTFNTYGTFWFRLTVTDGANVSASMAQSVALNAPPPNARFNLTPTDGTSPLTVTVDGVDLGGGPIDSWSWDFGDSTTTTGKGPHPHTYTLADPLVPQSFFIVLTYSGPGGSGTYIREIGVYPANIGVDAHFTWQNMGNVVGGVQICFTNLSTGPVATSAWDWEGDGTYDETNNNAVVCHTYATDGFRTVRLRVRNADSSSESTGSDVVNVLTAPVAHFTVTPGTSITWGTEVSFDSSGSTGVITSYSWDFNGDGIEDSNVAHPSNILLTQLGSNPIKLTVTGPGGTSTAEAIVFVARLEITCDFTGNLTVLPAAGAQVYTSVIGNDNGRAITYEWKITGNSAALPLTFNTEDISVNWASIGTGAFIVTLNASTLDGSHCSESKTINRSWAALDCQMTDTLPPVLYADGFNYTFAADVQNLDGRTVLGYEWYVDGNPQGVNAPTFNRLWSVEPATPTNETIRYEVLVDNGGGITSDCYEERTVTINPWSDPTCAMTNNLPPTLYADGNTYTFTADVGNILNRTVVGYKWFIDGVEQLGETGSTLDRVWTIAPGTPFSELIRYEFTVDNGNGTTSDCASQYSISVNTWPALTCTGSGTSFTGNANPIPAMTDNPTRNYTYTINAAGIANRSVAYNWTVEAATVNWQANNQINVTWPLVAGSIAPGTNRVISVDVTVTNPDGSTVSTNCARSRTVKVQVPHPICNIPTGDMNPVINETETYNTAIDSASLYGRPISLIEWELEESDGAGGWIPVTTQTGNSFSRTFLNAGIVYRLRYNIDVTTPDDSCSSPWLGINVGGSSVNFDCDAFPTGYGNNFAPALAGSSYAYTVLVDNGNSIPLDYDWILVGPGTTERVLNNTFTSSALNQVTGPSFSGVDLGPVGNYILRVDVRAVNNSDPLLPNYSDYTCSLSHALTVGTLNVQYTYADTSGGTINNNVVAVDQLICFNNTSDTSHPIGDINQLDYEWTISGNAAFNSLGVNNYAGQQLPGCFSFSEPGTYTVDLLGANHFAGDAAFKRTDSHSVTFTVYGLQSILINRSNQVFAPTSVTFNAIGTNITSNYTWTFINRATGNTVGTNTGATVNRFFNNPGNYRAIVRGTGPLGQTEASLDFSLIDASQLRAAFTPSLYGGVAPMTVCFTDHSVGTNITGWHWNFGDGHTSTEQNPCHTYTATSTTYPVRLDITNGTLNEFATNTVRTYSLLESSASFTITPGGSGEYCFNAMLTGNVSVTGWEFGDGINAGAQNMVCHTYSSTGTYIVRMAIRNNDNGETGTVIRTVTIDPGGASNPVLTASAACSADRTATFRIENAPAAGAMQTPEQVVVRNNAGDIILIDNVVLAAGAYREFVFSNYSGTISLTTLDFGLSASTACEYPPAVTITPACSHTEPVFTIANSDGPMIAPQTYEIRDSANNLILTDQFQLARGAAPIVIGIPLPNSPYEAYTLSSNGPVGAFSITHQCAQPQLSAVLTCSVPATITLTNTGSAMLGDHTFRLTGNDGHDWTPANNTVNLAGNTSTTITLPEDLDLTAGVTITSDDFGVTLNTTLQCTTLDDGSDLSTDSTPSPDEGFRPRFNGLAADLANLPAWSSVPACGRGCPVFRLYHTDETGDWEIFRLDGANESTRESFRQNLSFGEGTGINDMSPSLSPNNEWIVFSSNRDGNWEIYVASTGGNPLSAQRVTYNTIAIDTDPVWGPNNYVVYETTRHGQWDLYMIDMTTGREYRLTDNGADNINPFWSPDGSKIAFQSNFSDIPGEAGKWQIYEINLLTLTLRRLSDGTTIDVDPQYANNGAALVYRTYTADDVPSAIAIMDSNGDNRYQITTAGENATNPVWSPADRFIAYQSDLDGDLDVYIYDVAGQIRRKLTDNAIADYAPTWLCGEDRVVFTSDVMGNPDIFEADVLPISAAPILVDPTADQLTFESTLDIYPQITPSEENASREGQTVLGIFGQQTSFLNPISDRTPQDLSIDGIIRKDWQPVLSCFSQ